MDNSSASNASGSEHSTEDDCRISEAEVGSSFNDVSRQLVWARLSGGQNNSYIQASDNNSLLSLLVNQSLSFLQLFSS